MSVVAILKYLLHTVNIKSNCCASVINWERQPANFDDGIDLVQLDDDGGHVAIAKPCCRRWAMLC